MSHHRESVNGNPRLVYDNTNELEGKADDPHRIATLISDHRSMGNSHLPFCYHLGEYYEYRVTHWEHDPDFARGTLVRMVKMVVDHFTVKGSPPRVTRCLVADVDAVLKTIVWTRSRSEPPFHMMPNDEVDPPAEWVIPVRNGLLDVSGSERRLLEYNLRFFNTSYRPFAYDPGARAPMFERLLSDQWPNDPETIETLLEVFGYLLTSDTRQHKIFLLIGPTRSGKGTIRQILETLLGPDTVAATSIQSLGERFGLQPLRGRSLAIMGDARAGDTECTSRASDRLLRISGGDPVEIDVKNRGIETRKLNTRFLIMGNEIPNLRDQSGALVGRYVVISTTRQIQDDHIDIDLGNKIIAEEMPGVLNMALEGLDRLRRRGGFLNPESSLDNLEIAEDIASPVGRFAAETFYTHPNEGVSKQEAYDLWRKWAEAHGYASGSDAIFAKNLKAAIPSIKPRRLGSDGNRCQQYYGIGLLSTNGRVCY